MSGNQGKLVLLSAGGTGGHMTPAESLGRELLARGFRVEIITDQRGTKYASMFQGIPMHVVPSGTLGQGVVGKIRGLASLGIGILKARRTVRKLKPAVVVGFGGYPSIPGVLAAQRTKIPTVIHEQNAIIGRANLLLAPRATRIAISLPGVVGLEESDSARVILTGNPVRPEIAALARQPYPQLAESGVLKIFIMGGSLGAKVFSEVVPAALLRLSAEHRARLNIVQQCREETLPAVREAYSKAGIKAELAPFFTNVAEQLAGAHLVIARSGASTVAEVAAAGRPAIFVPYPHHKDQQQKINADSIADAGGAWTMTEGGFTAEALLARIETFLQNPENLLKAAQSAKKCGKPDAAGKLADVVIDLVRK